MYVTHCLVGLQESMKARFCLIKWSLDRCWPFGGWKLSTRQNLLRALMSRASRLKTFLVIKARMES